MDNEKKAVTTWVRLKTQAHFLCFGVQYTLLIKSNVLPSQGPSTRVEEPFFAALNSLLTPPGLHDPTRHKLPQAGWISCDLHTVEFHAPSTHSHHCRHCRFSNHFHSQVNIHLGQAPSTQGTEKSSSVYINSIDMYINIHAGYLHTNTHEVQ